MSAVLEVREPSARYVASSPPALLRSFDAVTGAAGGTARLRELILDLALRGKLVPQDSRDEHASSLLLRIRALKASTPAAGRAKGIGVGEGLEYEPPHELPPGWVWTSLSAIGQINPRIAADEGTTASFVPMSAIPIAFTDSHSSEPRLWRDIKAGFTQFAEGDVGVAKITPCFENGKSTVFKNLHSGIGAGTTELHIVRPLCGVEPRYVLLFLKSPRFLHQGEAVMTGTAGQKRLPRAYFESCPLPLPPLAEQARIVARVDELMRLCDALEEKGRLEAAQHARLLSTLLGTLTDSATPEELATNWQRVAEHFDLLLDRPEAIDALEEAVVELAIRGCLTQRTRSDGPAGEVLEQIARERIGSFPPPRRRAGSGGGEGVLDPLLFDVPEGWVWAQLGELTLKVTDGTHHTPRYLSSGVPFISVKDIDGKTVSFDDCRYISPEEHQSINSRCDPRRGDILLCRIGTLGRPTIVDTDQAFSLFVSVGLLKLPKTIDIAAFLHLALSSPLLRLQYDAIKAGGSHTNKLNLGDIPRLMIPLPPLAEQARIVARVTELRSLCTTLRQRLQAQQATQSRLAEALVEQALAG